MRTLLLLIVVACQAAAASGAQAPQPRPAYRIETDAAARKAALSAADEARLALLEKLNRADRAHLPRLPVLVLPVDDSADENDLAYSPMPLFYAPAAGDETYLVVHLPGQMFGAYESGVLVRWGPVSSGARATPTPSGQFFLTWRSKGHVSSVDPDWYLPWYFNFENRLGLAFHAYSLPGLPASHGCIRLLERDARWLYGWGRGWTLQRGVVVQPGTPVRIIGAFDHSAPPPWRSLEWLQAGGWTGDAGRDLYIPSSHVSSP